MESLLYPSARQPPPLAAARRSREDPSLRALAALHWPQYIAILLLGAALAASGHAAPFFETHAPIYGDISLVYVHYSYPQLPTPQVPDWVLPLVALGLPLFVLASAWGSGWIRRREAHHCGVAVVACVVTAALLNNLIKMQASCTPPLPQHRRTYVWGCPNLVLLRSTSSCCCQAACPHAPASASC